MTTLSRRDFLARTAGALGGVALTSGFDPTTVFANAPERKSSARIAAIVTEYRPLSHADVILTRLVEDYPLTNVPVRSPVRLHSMYVDQFPDRDMARWIAKTYGVRLTSSISEAVLNSEGKLDVDAVWIIGEHGNYPHNERGQHLYPRRRFFEAVVKAFEKAGKVVPVFNDKHLSARWKDAKWMVDRARAMKIPFLAGSSLPLTWRRPVLEFPLDTPLEMALAVGYSGIESYGFHALETYQCMVERRQGGETGLASVRCLEGPEVWDSAKAGFWSEDLLLAALERQGISAAGLAEVKKRVPKPAVFLLEHRDGFRGAVLMLNGIAGHISFAAKLPGQARPVSTHFWLQEPVYGHFSYLTRAISELTLSGVPPYPVERTLLTTGALCRAMDSRFEGHRKIETPELEIVYRSTDHGLGAFSQGEDPHGRSGGWIELFDGKSLGNWRENVWEGEPRWEVSDGVLSCTGGKGYLATLEEFEDFELSVQARVWDREGGRGNSGIYFRCQPHRDKSREYPPGYESQIDHGDSNNPTGSIYGRLGPGARARPSRTADRRWLTMRIRAEGPRLRTWVNGELVVDWTDPEARHKKGTVLLQQHHTTGVVEFREVRIRRIENR